AFEERKRFILLAREIVNGIDPKRHTTIRHEREKRRPSLTEEGVNYLERSLAEKLGLPHESDKIWRDGEAEVLLYHVLRALEARWSVDLGQHYISGQDTVLLVSSGTGHRERGAR